MLSLGECCFRFQWNIKIIIIVYLYNTPIYTSIKLVGAQAICQKEEFHIIHQRI